MFNPLSLKLDSFSLDISDLSLKIIKLKKKRAGFSIVSFGESIIKPGIIKEGEIRKEKELMALIKKTISQVQGEKLGTKNVIASLPEERAFLQVIQMPRLASEDLKSAVVYEAENYIPLPIEEVYLDSQVIEPLKDSLDHQDVLIAALPKKTVDSYLSCFKAAGLEPLAFEIESLALSRALIKNETAPEPVLLIDLGATRTSLTIFSGRSLRFTFSIPVCGHSLTEAIARTINVDLAEAEQLKMKHGLKGRNTTEGEQVFSALIPPLTDLFEQIRKHITYYQEHASHEHLIMKSNGVKQVLLCGGGANLRGLQEYFAKQLKIPVQMGNPGINILPQTKKGPKVLPPNQWLRFTTALGLGLRGFQEDDD